MHGDLVFRGGPLPARPAAVPKDPSPPPLMLTRPPDGVCCAAAPACPGAAHAAFACCALCAARTEVSDPWTGVLGSQIPMCKGRQVHLPSRFMRCQQPDMAAMVPPTLAGRTQPRHGNGLAQPPAAVGSREQRRHCTRDSIYTASSPSWWVSLCLCCCCVRLVLRRPRRHLQNRTRTCQREPCRTACAMRVRIEDAVTVHAGSHPPGERLDSRPQPRR